MYQENFISKLESTIELSDFLRTIDSMGVGLTIVDARKEDLPLVYVNKGFIEMTGYQPEEILLKNCRFLQGPETEKKQVNKIRTAIRQYKSETVILKNYRKDGTFFWNQFIISPILGQDHQPLYYIGLQFDITKQVKDKQGDQQKIKRLSNYDQLTGLMKLHRFKEVMQNHIDTSVDAAVVLKVNLNRFRNINNSYGEYVSDEVLVEVSNRLRSVFGSVPITRSFADDFIVFLSNTTYIENILSAVELTLDKPYSLLGEEISIDFGIGISQYPDNGTDVEQLLSYAALALREAKQEPVKHHYFFSDTLRQKLESRMTIEKSLAKGLANREFIVHYQPKVSVETSDIVGMEALVRWQDPKVGMVSPGEFIPIAEETGFINELGKWILYEACSTNKMWQDKGLTIVPVSVNVSAVQFTLPNFTDIVQDVLLDTGLDASFLELEITETVLVHPDNIIDKLNKLKQIGVLISIDDFGTGYSSIQYLKELPIDILKIDRAFVQNTPDSSRDNALLQSIIQLGKSLGLTILAEGVEESKQVHYLNQSQCDQIQGFYFSRPLDREEMEKNWLS